MGKKTPNGGGIGGSANRRPGMFANYQAQQNNYTPQPAKPQGIAEVQQPFGQPQGKPITETSVQNYIKPGMVDPMPARPQPIAQFPELGAQMGYAQQIGQQQGLAQPARQQFPQYMAQQFAQYRGR